MEEGQEGDDDGASGSVPQVQNEANSDSDKMDKVVTENPNQYEAREYQASLFEMAIKENIIVCLPTGSGKSFIAVQLVKHYLASTIELSKNIIFIATTVPLVHQQGEYLKNHIATSYSGTSSHVQIVTGYMKPEDWDGTKWKSILDKYQVFSMTDQILYQAITRGHITWDKISLIVLDECHNATKNHPMMTLMNEYCSAIDKGGVIDKTVPRILGLTATIIKGDTKGFKSDSIPQEILCIESKFRARAVTFHDYEQVLKCSTSAKVTLMPYKTTSPCKQLLNLTKALEDLVETLGEPQIKSYFEKEFDARFAINHPTLISSNQVFGSKENPLDKYRALVTDILDVFHDLGPYCTHTAVIMYLAVLEKEKQTENRKGRNKNLHLFRMIECIIFQLELFVEMLERYMESYQYKLKPDTDRMLFFATPKLKEVYKILRILGAENDASKDPFCGIIFCRKRMTAQVLSYYIQELAQKSKIKILFRYLRCDFVLGTSGNSNRNHQILKINLQVQSGILDEFRDHKLNLLVATNVLEEGLNVPSCNFVLRFDPIQSYPSFVQSMGRARQPNAKFYVLVEESLLKTAKEKLKEYEDFNNCLSAYLRDNALHPERYEDLIEVPEWELDQLIPPFQPLDGPQKITASSAVQLIYRYCQSLATDKLSALIPIAWWTSDDQNGLRFKVYVRLPPNSAVKMAEGGYFTSKCVAKKAAFMDACIKLWYAGALNPSTLLPFPRNTLIFSNEFLEELEGKDDLVGGKKVGSRNRFSWHQKKIPDVFTIAAQIGSKNVSLNVYALVFTIEDKVFFGAPETEKIYQFNHTNYYFGIVTAADLSNVNDFLLLSRDGNFRVSLKKLEKNSGLIFDEEKVQLLLDFQKFIFSDVLEIIHEIFSTSSKPAYFIAPLKTQVKGDLLSSMIDWDIVPRLLKSREIDYKSEVSVTNRRTMIYKPEDYQDAVVLPWYTKQYHDQQLNCVIDVETDKNPLSPFTDPTKYSSFKEYYDLRYDLSIIDPNQPLLRVKPLSKQLNYLQTKFDAALISKEERQWARFTKSVVTFIPEFVRIHPLPSCLYIQAKFLPSCLHRLNRLLLAEEIRSSVAILCSLRVNLNFTKENNVYIRDLNQAKAELARRETTFFELTPTDKKEASKISVYNPQNVHQKEDFKTEESSTVSTKLSWSQIEHIHPLNLKRTELNPSDCEDDEDDCVSENEFSRSSSPSVAQLTGIELICFDKVPSQNFDDRTDFNLEKGPMPINIMEALTLSNGRDVVSLEKQEVIGDSVLKFVTTTNIMANFPKWNEGKMTTLRTRLISNKHLYRIGMQKNINCILSGSLFSPEDSWIPPCYEIKDIFTETAVLNEINYSVYKPVRNSERLLESIDWNSLETDEIKEIVKSRKLNNADELQAHGTSNNSYTHARIGEKSVADCVEALIGSYYLHGGLDNALHVMNWVGLRGPTQDSKVSPPYKHFRDLPLVIPDYPEKKPTLIPYFEELEETLNYRFKNPWLVVEALTHPTYVHNEVTASYERLEFIGDAVLDFIITHYIYRTKMAETPGSLTDLRSALVNNITFGSLSVRYGFYRQLLSFSKELEDRIASFVSYQKTNGHQVLGQFQLVSDSDCLMAEDIEVPKVLGDIFESLAGAIFLDSGYSLETVWKVFYRLMKNEIDKFSKDIPKSPVRELMEMFPNAGQVKIQSIECEKLQEVGYKVIQIKIARYPSFYGCGTKKVNAKSAAAKFALRQIKAKTDGEREKAKSHLLFTDIL